MRPTISELPRDERRRRTRTLFAQARDCEEPQRAHLLSDIVVANLPVARSIARRYAGRGIPAEDLEQVAYVALVRAVHRFQVEQSDDFLTYAVPTIRGEIKRWFRDHGWMVRPPRHLQELQASIQAVRSDATEDLDDAAIAARIGCTEDEVREALSARGCFTPSSLDAPVGDSDGSLMLGDTLASDDNSIEATETRFVLEQALSKLSPREQLIVRLRYVEELSQAEIGEAIGVTQTQVSRILKRIRDELREELQGVA